MSKRGITALNQQETSQPIAFHEFPEEVYPIIFNNIAAYKFIGKEKIASVSKTWKNFIEANNFFDKKSYSKVIESCLQDPEGVLYILGDESIRQYLTFNQILEISGCNPKLALHILGTQELLDKFEGYDLACLGRHNLAIAQHILDTDKLCDALLSGNIVTLGKHHLAIAQHLLDTDKLCNRLDGFDLAILGRHHPAIAQRILDTQKLYDRLSMSDIDILKGGHLSAFPIKHLDIDQYIINKQNLNKLNDVDLTNLSRKFPAIAQHVVDTQALRNKIRSSEILELERKCSFVSSVFKHVANLSNKNEIDVEPNEMDVEPVATYSGSCVIC